MQLLMLATVGGGMEARPFYLMQFATARALGTAVSRWTFAISITGRFAMCAVATAVALRFGGAADVRALLAIGNLGGFTIFSAFSHDAAHLMDKHQHTAAAFSVPGPVAVSILAPYAGVMLAKAILS